MSMSIYSDVSKLSVLHLHMALSIYSDVSKLSVLTYHMALLVNPCFMSRILE